MQTVNRIVKICEIGLSRYFFGTAFQKKEKQRIFAAVSICIVIAVILLAVYGVFLWVGSCVFLIAVSIMAYASFNISSGVYLSAFCRKRTAEKLVALTFDDGPHPEHTPRVLDVLKQYDVKATFFVTGKHIAGNEAVVKRMLAEGHQIGNHSFSHSKTLPFAGAEKMASDLMQCRQVVENAAGYTPSWFRPPFGVTNPNVAKAAVLCGCKTAGWSIRSFDTARRDDDRVARRVVSRLHPGAVILLHDRLPGAPLITEKIVRHASEKGYGFATVSQFFD